MPLHKTVYVVGAGASCEMGLPSGESLKLIISDLLRYDTEWGGVTGGSNVIRKALHAAEECSPLAQHGRTLEQVARQISNALPVALSIDNYLNSHKGNALIERCGKFAIVQAIRDAEHQSKLFNHESEDIAFDFNKCAELWLIPFVQLLTEACGVDAIRARLSSITFVVFNYDRCVEQFLFHALQTIYSLGDDDTADLVNCIEILHPYGTVGNLPWSNKGQPYADFGEYAGDDMLQRFAESIKTFTEETLPTDSTIQAIQSAVDEASRVVFLGFAYHQMNIDLLLGSNKRSQTTRQIYGTAFGVSDSDADFITKMIDEKFNAPTFKARNLKCFHLYREYSRVLGFN